MTVPRLWEHHIQELRASGLSDGTIAAARLYSATEAQVRHLLGFGRGPGLAFPYLHTVQDGGEPFTRVKADRANSSAKRYCQRKGSGNRLYIPPTLDPAVLEDPAITLYITEGEKKALKAVQEGLVCVSVSGVDSWRSRVDGPSRPIADLDRIEWKGRETFIVFDSDIIQKDRVRWAESMFAQELTRRGAKVQAVRLPPGPNGEKVGLDDFLINHSVETFCQLEPVPVTRPRADREPGATVGPAPLPAEAPAAELPAFPDQAYVGLAGEFAATYSERLEAPPQFFYLDYLTYLGALVATHVRLDTQLREEPRLYSVKVADSWLGRKSSAQDEVGHFYGPLAQDRLVFCYGAGSAEGLGKKMERALPTMLVYDELRAFVDKAKVEGSVLLPMVASLFSRTVYENATRHAEIHLPDAHLSLVAACTVETFQRMFSPTFRAIGFINRLFLVAGRRGALHPVPARIPDETVDRLRDRTREQLDRAEREKPVLAFVPDARARWDEWYRALHTLESPYVARLDSYGLRFLMLFAVTSEAWQITRPLVDATITLLDYELQVRRDLDPVDAEGTVARLERYILRHLRKGRMTESRLRAFCHVKETGLWAFDQAMKNLGRRGWLASRSVGRGLNWWLTETGTEAAHDA